MPKGGNAKKAAVVAPAPPAKRTLTLFVPKESEKIFFTENLRVMLRAGVPLSQAFGTLELQAETKAFKRVITEIGKGLERGETLAQNLALHPQTFSPIYVNMIRVGEVSGTLERSLEELAVQMKKERTLKSKIKGALTYPIIILVATVGISIGMMIFVVPQILSIFNEINAELPLATRILIGITTFAQKNGVWIALGAILFAGGIWTMSRQPVGRRVIHTVLITIPILGPIVRKVNLARYTRTLSTLLRTDVPVADAFKITADVMGNIHFREATLMARDRIQKGVAVASAINESSLFPRLVGSMVKVGEESGTLDDVLLELANFYEAQVDETLSNLSQIIEPLLILTLGAAVGGVAFAVISPIYSLAENI